MKTNRLLHHLLHALNDSLQCFWRFDLDEYLQTASTSKILVTNKKIFFGDFTLTPSHFDVRR